MIRLFESLRLRSAVRSSETRLLGSAALRLVVVCSALLLHLDPAHVYAQSIGSNNGIVGQGGIGGGGGSGCVTTGSAILMGNGSGGCSNANAGTQYAPATSGSSVLLGNGSGGFSSLSGNTLASHNFANSISAAGAISGAQPSFSDISGTASIGQVPYAGGLQFGGTQIGNTGTAPTSGQCLEYNGTGITGATCSGGSSGTVNSGTAGQMAYYASSSNAVSGAADANISAGSLTLGLSGSVLGDLILDGNTSGAIMIQPQAAAGTYNFNLPTSAGTSGQPLLSAGGGSAPMTFGTLNAGNGGTGDTSPAAHSLVMAEGGSPFNLLTAATAGDLVVDQGTGADWAEKAMNGDATMNSAAALNVTGLHFGSTDLQTTSTAPTSGQCLEYNGTGITGAACSPGSTCAGTVSMSFGLGLFSNGCVTTSSVCRGRDVTNPAVTVAFDGYASGQVTVHGANSDTIQVQC